MHLALWPVVVLVVALTAREAVVDAALYEYGLGAGDTLATDTETTTAPQAFPFFDRQFTEISTHHNGYLSLSGPTGDTCPFVPTDVAKIAPYFSHININEGQLWFGTRTDAESLALFSTDLRATGVISNSFEAQWAFVATWFEVQCVGCGGLHATVQLMLATDWTNSAVLFKFDDLQFPTPQTTFCAWPMIGFDWGNNNDFYEIAGSRTTAAGAAATTSNIGENGVWAFQCCSLDPNPPMPCESNPCQNDGVCTNINDNMVYVCECTDMFEGENCQDRILPCESNPCQNGGVCTNTNEDTAYGCECTDMFEGENCQDPILPCESNPCQNDGVCTNTNEDTAYGCECTDMFEGENCQDPILPCESNPCQNGGVCTNINEDTAYGCECTDMFEGENCQDAVPSCVECACNNDPHCRTFDGSRNEHHFGCVSRFVHKCPEAEWPFPDVPELKILADNIPCYYNVRVTCVDGLQINFGDITIIPTATLGLQIQVGNGLLVAVDPNCLPVWPDPNCAPAAPADSLIRVQRLVNAIEITTIIPRFGHITTRIVNSRFSIKIHGREAVKALRGVLCGNCGRYNGDATDDFDGMALRDFQHSQVVEPHESCDGYVVPAVAMMALAETKQALPTEWTDRCADTDVLAQVMATCALINDPNGPFGVCFEIDDRQLYYEDCVTDTCSAQEYLEPNLAGFASTCGYFGQVGDWRAQLNLPFACPATMEYSTCVDESCFKSCNFPDPCPHGLPPTRCFEGCVCTNENHIYDSVSNACIDPSACGTTEAAGFDDWDGIGGDRYSGAHYSLTRCDDFDTEAIHCSKHGYCVPPGTTLTSETCEQYCTCTANKKGTKTKWKCGKKLKQKAACEECASGEVEECDESIKFVFGMQGCLRVTGKGGKKVCRGDLTTCLQGEINLLQVLKKKDNKLISDMCA